MKLLIRADANNFIATGHVMRCISIAQAAIDEGHEVKFITADLDAKSLLDKYNMQYICLQTKWNEMDGEIEQISNVVAAEKPDCILVDSYYVTQKYLSHLRSLCKVAYVDDLNKFIYPCDMLICYANHYRKFDYESRYTSDTKLVLGPLYAPLRPIFSKLEHAERQNLKKNILVMSGGADEYHLIADFLHEYTNNLDQFKNVTITAICGVYNKDYVDLVEMYSGNPDIKLLKSVDNIEKYMLEANIAVSAGGSTLFELCACGTPTVCYALADNQLDNVASFAADEVMIYAGDIRGEGTLCKITSSVAELLTQDCKRMAMIDKMKGLVDGDGARRIVREIGKII